MAIDARMQLNPQLLESPLLGNFSESGISPVDDSSRESTLPKFESVAGAEKTPVVERRLSRCIQNLGSKVADVVLKRGLGGLKECIRISKVCLFGLPREKPDTALLLQSQIYVCVEGLKTDFAALKRYCFPSEGERQLATGESLETVKGAHLSLSLSRVQDTQALITKFKTSEKAFRVFEEFLDAEEYLSLLERVLRSVTSDRKTLTKGALAQLSIYTAWLDGTVKSLQNLL